ncbi:MAG: type I phosphomannose isomerase catalytic subunit [Puniceicoccaceae bacterium]
MKSLVFEPFYQERVWGGSALSDKLGRALPSAAPIGESWEIVDRPEANSKVSRGPCAGLSLRELLTQKPDWLMGPGYPPGRPFPILVKWLDCTERLSLQVHPPATVAPQLGGEPKTENWYIADCTSQAALILGLRHGVTREAFEAALGNQTLESCVHRFPIKPGTSVLVESGRIHAIDAGNLILEIQQNSDTTYRVYDWGRLGLDGQARQLHVEESLRSIDFGDFEPAALPPIGSGVQSRVLADCSEFRIREVLFSPGTPLSFPAGNGPSILSIVCGSLSEGQIELPFGTNLVLPSQETIEFTPMTDGVCLITDQFI